MNASHQRETDANGTYDVLEESNAGIRVKIRRTGAEMVSLARRNALGTWTGFLYRDGETSIPQSGWANHATVMGYYIHRLINQESHYRDAIIKGGNHGFIRSFEFSAPIFDAGRAALTYRVDADAIPPEAYPLRVAMDLTYRFEGERLVIEFRFTNEEPETEAHVSFGLHPGFAVASLDEAEVLMPAGTYIRHWAPDNFLDGREDRIPFNGGPMPFAKDDLPGSFLLGLGEVVHPVFTVRDPLKQREIKLDFSGVPYMTIWSDLSPMICVEPCWGLPDSKPQKPFEEKVGIQKIPPRSFIQASCAITPRLTQ